VCNDQLEELKNYSIFIIVSLKVENSLLIMSVNHNSKVQSGYLKIAKIQV
jgi:hypothetical protein